MQKGQTMIELLVAMGVFILLISVITFLILDAHISDRSARERTQATFLAEEGLEQARSIRDNNWLSLVSISPETIDKFIRTVTVEDLDSEIKKVTSQITWQISDLRSQEVSLITYLTNWQASTLDCNTICQNNGFSKGRCLTAKACRKGILFGGLGEYQCSTKKLCCCE
jgi:type II secretory pathway pseudopilin PulG